MMYKVATSFIYIFSHNLYIMYFSLSAFILKITGTRDYCKKILNCLEFDII